MEIGRRTVVVDRNVVLFDHLYGTAEEGRQCSTFQHAVLQQGKVNQLMDDVAALCIFGDNLVFFVLLLTDGVLSGLHVVFLFLCDFLRLFLALFLTEDGKAGVQPLDFCKDGLQCFSAIAGFVLW